MDKKTFKINFTGEKVTLRSDFSEPEQQKTNPFRIEQITECFGKINIVTDISDAFNKFDQFFENFSDEIIKMGLPEKNITKIFNLCDSLMRASEKLRFNLINAKIDDTDTKNIVLNHLSTVNAHIENQIKANCTQFKRDKIQKNNILYVPPEGKSISLKWRTKIHSDEALPDFKLVQSTFQYVPIVKTIQSLFSDENFKKVFFEYNANKHKCVPGIYKDYCCGRRFLNNELIKLPNSIHIQLGIDDVEVCCALKTKSTLHKVTAIYFKILNLPAKLSARLNQIFLVAVCETANIKANDRGLDPILEFIVQDFKHLEQFGITVDDQSLKGFLINVCFDNLGGNGLYGLKESFASDYFCRICEMTLKECQTSTHEVKSKLRDTETYDIIVQTLERNFERNFSASKGISKKSLMNEIPFFHFLKNIYVDPMHDIWEGVNSFFVEKLIVFCCDKRYYTLGQICKMFRDFNYGVLNKKNRPSEIKLNRSNLGQNASQMYCIMKYLPFVLKNLQTRLPAIIIKSMCALLRAMQIIFSNEVTDHDISQLKLLIEEHLTSFKEAFDTLLKAKQHFATHYPYVMEEMGPIKRMSMMRYEAKHKVLTTIAKKTNNFVNIAKTLAERVQTIDHRSRDFNDVVSKSKSFKFSDSENFMKFNAVMLHFDFELNELDVLDKFLIFNGFEYRRGLMIVENFKVFEIQEIFLYKNNYFLLCQTQNVIQFEEFFNSIEIQSTAFELENMKIFEVSALKNGESFDKVRANKKNYIIAENLNVMSVLKK